VTTPRAITSRVLHVAKSPARWFARLTGLQGGGHVSQFIADDVRSLIKFAASPAARRRERDAAAKATDTERCFDFSQTYFGVGPVQHRSEIAALLDLALENGAKVVCEIGAQDAGTTVLFSRVLNPDTLLVMDLFTKNRWRLRRAAPTGQTVHVVDGDSTHSLTVRRLRRKLRGQPIDLLLIDGDHRWIGVRHDFLTYRKFVRDGGLIAFHDICEATDPHSPLWTGDVPAFWRAVSALYSSHEFIDTPAQQGLGIGVIRYDPTRSVEPLLAAEPPS
jgi:cephalosporin hydroxylase